MEYNIKDMYMEVIQSEEHAYWWVLWGCMYFKMTGDMERNTNAAPSEKQHEVFGVW